ncbi:7TM diverse intracellular signaling domain-containing protein, partial [Hymenobacter agri]
MAVPPDSAYSFARVQAPAWASRFRKSEKEAPYVSGKREVWLRTTVLSETSPHTNWVLRSKLFESSTIDVYVEHPDGSVQRLALGPDGPGARGRVVANRCYNLVLPLVPGQATTLYLRTWAGMLDYRISEINHLQKLSYWENFLMGLFFGSMLMLALYNLFLFVSLREATYGYYVAYVLSFGTMNLLYKGVVLWWLPGLSVSTHFTLRLLVSAATTVFSALLTRAYLETRRLAPRLDWLLTAIVLTAPLPLLGHWLLPGHTALLAQVLPLFSGGATLLVGMAVLRTGYRPARYYMVGAGLVIVSVLAYSLAQLGLLPSNELTMNGTAVAWLLDLVCLSLGLADRISLAQQARQTAQLEAMTHLREKEEAQLAANHQLATRAAELEHAYNELRTSLATTEQLKSLDELKTNFFTNISHEFRTPLTLILGPAEELATEAPDATTRAKSELIRRNAGRLLRLINQLLDLSKLEAGAMLLLPERADLAAFARQLAATFASMAEARNIAFRTTGPARLPFIFDAPKLDVVLTNLLSNALRFTPAGGTVEPSRREVPAAGAVPAGVELLVHDTGPGVPPAQQPHLFDRFYQGSTPAVPGTQPGTGVGLALVKELTELHQGTVTLVSPPGAGAAFRVWLPQGLRPAPANAAGLASVETTASHRPELELFDAAPAEADTPVANPEADFILCIEDNEDVRTFIRSSLAPAGYRLLEAPDGLRGVEMALEHVPDLIVSDVMMPGLDGYGVVRQLKAHPATSHVPLVLLTAKSASHDRLEGLETGADAYVGK